MGVISFAAAPAVGYGGEIAKFSVQSILLVLVISVVVGNWLRKPDVDRSRAVRWLVGVNLIALALVVVTSGVLTILRPIQTVAGGVQVRYVKLPGSGYSRPLIEDDAVYLVGRQGLIKVDVVDRSVNLMTELPAPTPSEVGLTGYRLSMACPVTLVAPCLYVRMRPRLRLYFPIRLLIPAVASTGHGICGFA